MSKRSYMKPFLTYDEQIHKLINSGLGIPDFKYAEEKLRRHGYYRLSGYWYSFRELRSESEPGAEVRSDLFIDGYSFDHVIQLYEFDRNLRLLIMDAIERVEVSVRHEIAYQLGKDSPFPQTERRFFDRKFWSSAKKSLWDAREQRNLERSHERFANHYRSAYLLPMPIWISVEVWDFGMLSAFYQGLAYKRKSGISQAFGISHPIVFQNWLRSINDLRNIAAHHGRTWNRSVEERISPPKAGESWVFDHVMGDQQVWELANSRIYTQLLVLNHLLRVIQGTGDWAYRVRNLLLNFPVVPNHSTGDMGAPQTWMEEAAWNNY